DYWLIMADRRRRTGQLPYATLFRSPRAKDNGEEKPEASERKLNLLVVEDDEKILEAISEYFSRAGYNVQTAEDGLSGVQAALNEDRKSTRLNSSHLGSSYAVCCLKK